MGFMDDVLQAEANAETTSSQGVQPPEGSAHSHSNSPGGGLESDTEQSPHGTPSRPPNPHGQNPFNLSSQQVAKRALDLEWSPRKKQDLKKFGESLLDHMEIPDDEHNGFLEACQVCFYCPLLALLNIICSSRNKSF